MAKLLELENVKSFEDSAFLDDRGQLFTIWNKKHLNMPFNHDKVAISKKNVLRGLHTDKSWKLISCLFGKIQLVVVNFDKNSLQYLNYVEYILDAEKTIKHSILVPPGYLNGHLVLSDMGIFHYKWFYEGDYPDVNDQLSINCFDPKINIEWLSHNFVLSERDEKAKYIE